SAADRVEAQVSFLDEHPEYGIVSCFTNICAANGRLLWTQRPRPGSLSESGLRRYNPLAHGSLCLRRALLSRLSGYDSRFALAQDYDLLLRASRITRIGVVSRPLYSLRQ